LGALVLNMFLGIRSAIRKGFPTDERLKRL